MVTAKTAKPEYFTRSVSGQSGRAEQGKSREETLYYTTQILKPFPRSCAWGDFETKYGTISYNLINALVCS